MKKIMFLFFLAISISLALILVLNPQPVNGSKYTAPALPGTELPDSVMKVVKKACMDCHADDGNFMAKGKVNFSTWGSYDDQKQMKKAASICKQLTKSSMPPKKWCANNLEAVPTQAEKDVICRWANSLQK
jgi:uncharacterized membrane protein